MKGQCKYTEVNWNLNIGYEICQGAQWCTAARIRAATDCVSERVMWYNVSIP